jgi:hypothetical protein
MKKLISVLLIFGVLLLSPINAFAVVLGDGEVDSSEELNRIVSIDTAIAKKPVIDREFAALIAAKEATLNPPSTDVLRAAASYPSSVRLAGVIQYAQETGSFCGPAAVKSLLKNEGITVSQTTLAGSSYLKTNTYGSTPWYITNGSTLSQYPVYNTLHAYISSSFLYLPYPSGQLGAAPPAAELKNRIMYTTSSGHAIIADGVSNSSTSSTSHLPGYPTTSNISHWIVSDGYSNSGSSIWIVDPVSGASSVSWSGGVSRYYSITLTKFTAFVAPRGIFW